MLRAVLQPGDVLLVEGNQRFSVAIKYLTQSTWSHAALFVGEIGAASDSSTEPLTLIEADLEKGVHAVPLSYYEGFNTRICRPVGLLAEDLQKVVTFMVESLDMKYDLKSPWGTRSSRISKSCSRVAARSVNTLCRRSCIFATIAYSRHVISIFPRILW
jgi:hypothetical protein